MKCLVVIWIIATGEFKEMTFHAKSCAAIYEMAQYKASQSDGIEVLMITQVASEPE